MREGHHTRSFCRMAAAALRPARLSRPAESVSLDAGEVGAGAGAVCAVFAARGHRIGRGRLPSLRARAYISLCRFSVTVAPTENPKQLTSAGGRCGSWEVLRRRAPCSGGFGSFDPGSLDEFRLSRLLAPRYCVIKTLSFH